MWFGRVDIPEHVIEAHAKGELAIFVGAGASIDPPSGLPSFRGLTERIAGESNFKADAARLQDNPDRVLGDITLRGDVDVHARVAEIIGSAASQPNALHGAIALLARAGPRLRIVTTNYDEHLTTALTSQPAFVEYLSPALPMGDDFDGLVYIHGCVRQEPRHLVVTDADFGRAYLTDAWAARFLERLFSKFTVLFIGYSHSDIVMTYLARGLGQRSQHRYALTPREAESDWHRLGIHAIGYDVDNDSHEALGKAIRLWGERASFGLLDHRQLIARLVASAPPQVPDQQSYLEAAIASDETARFFTEHARGIDWLNWATAQPVFRQLFGAIDVSNASRELAWWFAEHFVANEELSSEALRVVQDLGGAVGPVLQGAIGHRIHIVGGPRPTWLSPWLVLLIEADNPANSDWLELALAASRWPDDRDIALLLFDYLIQPRAVFRRSFVRDERPRFDIAMRGSDHTLREVWQSLLRPNLVAVAPEIIGIADSHLRRAHRLLAATGSATSTWDPLSFSRSAIEPHSQDAYPDPIDEVIDAARDSLESLFEHDTQLASAYVRMWERSDVVLLRRLAAHGWTQRVDVSAAEKLAWSREQGRLFDHHLKHEVFRLLAEALPDAALSDADELVRAAVEGPAQRNEHTDYESFNLLAWITRSAPELASAREALDATAAAHPTFGERDQPDFSHWMGTASFRSRPPMPVELDALLTDDAKDAVDALLQYRHSTPDAFEAPAWEDALELLSTGVQQRPEVGLNVMECDLGEDRAEFVSAIVRGWASASLDDETATRILARLNDEPNLDDVGDEIARLLAGWSRSDGEAVEWHRITGSRDLAIRLWHATPAVGTESTWDDSLGRAVNHRCGQIAEFWVRSIGAEWRHAGDSWSGLSDTVQAQLTTMLDTDDPRSHDVEPVFGSQLQFFFAADRRWCEEQLLPRFDWNSSPESAARVWSGFLQWGAANDSLLAAGLLDYYLQTAARYDGLSETLREQLTRQLAAVALFSDVNPIEHGWLSAFTTTVNPDGRVRLIENVAHALREMPLDGVLNSWATWMRRYWQARLHSVPSTLTVEEASALPAWIAYLGPSIPEGVALATQHDVQLEGNSFLLHDLARQDAAEQSESIGELVAHLLRGTSPPFWDCRDVAEIVRQLKSQRADYDATPIVEQALRLSCADATNW